MTSMAETYDDGELQLVIDYMEAARGVLESEAAELRATTTPRASTSKPRKKARPARSVA